MNITLLQEQKLKRFSERIRKLRMDGSWQYKVRVTCIPAWRGLPGMVAMTANTPEHFERLQRMLQRVVPGAQLHNFEHGRGWHYADRTAYYYAEFAYTVIEP